MKSRIVLPCLLFVNEHLVDGAKPTRTFFASAIKLSFRPRDSLLTGHVRRAKVIVEFVRARRIRIKLEGR